MIVKQAQKIRKMKFLTFSVILVVLISCISAFSSAENGTAFEILFQTEKRFEQMSLALFRNLDTNKNRFIDKNELANGQLLLAFNRSEAVQKMNAAITGPLDYASFKNILRNNTDQITVDDINNFASSNASAEFRRTSDSFIKTQREKMCGSLQDSQYDLANCSSSNSCKATIRCVKNERKLDIDLHHLTSYNKDEESMAEMKYADPATDLKNRKTEHSLQIAGITLLSAIMLGMIVLASVTLTGAFAAIPWLAALIKGPVFFITLAVLTFLFTYLIIWFKNTEKHIESLESGAV